MSQLVSASKFLSFVLRHKPGAIGLQLDGQGWADVQELIERAKEHGTVLSEALILDVVRTSDKKRFALSASGDFIRANQGHSIDVDLGLLKQTPRACLFHGTASRFLDSILAMGLVKGARHHVHLSADTETASKVGRRHGRLVLLAVASEQMDRDGHTFYRSENGVWLTDTVPAKYLSVLASEHQS